MRERITARVLLFDPDDRLLLMKGRLTADQVEGFWFTVGGGAREGEDLGACALREIREETGFQEVRLGPVVHTREVVLSLTDGEERLFKESYFVARCDGGEPVRDGWEADEHALIDQIRWWTLKELAATAERVFPEGCANLAIRASRLQP